MGQGALASPRRGNVRIEAERVCPRHAKSNRIPAEPFCRKMWLNVRVSEPRVILGLLVGFTVKEYRAVLLYREGALDGKS